jgi:putative flippase GtrA
MVLVMEAHEMNPRGIPSPSPAQETNAEDTSAVRAATEARPADAGARRGEGTMWQAGLFALVGVANTALDFAVYNLLTSRMVGWSRIPANLVSTTIAMSFSFALNLLWVFSPQHKLVPQRAFRFIWVTCCALYGVQNLVLWLTSNVWSGPFDQLAAECQRVLSLGAGHEDLIARNLVKALATVASMTWNYLWYRFYAFRDF